MTDQNQHINPKVVDRMRKLMALATDGGATEGEAAAAMSRLQEMMAKYNISMATVEASGETGEDGARLKTNYGGPEARKTKGGTSAVGADYQRQLMSVIGHVNFCTVYIIQSTFKMRGGRRQSRPTGYEIIGRQVNVIAAQTTFEYLNATINRIGNEYGRSIGERNMSNAVISFKRGLSDRIQTRLWQRYWELQEQTKREKAAAQAAQPAGQNALVLSLVDVETKERDLNADFENGWEPGTAERRRLEREARRAAEKAAEEEKRAAGIVDPEEDDVPEETEAQRKKREAREKREEERRQARYNREAAKINWSAYQDGENAGDKVSLDKQIDEARAKAAAANRRIG